jgi:hypothetical protein
MEDISNKNVIFKKDLVIETGVDKIDWYNFTLMAYNKGGIRNSNLTIDISFK